MAPLRLGGTPSSFSHLLRARPSSSSYRQLAQPLRRTGNVPRSRLYTSSANSTPGTARRIFGRLVRVVIFGTLGLAAGVVPLLLQYRRMAQQQLSSEETLRAFTPPDAESQAVEDYINSHPAVLELRARPELTESRPHLKIPEQFRRQSLTAGTLTGPGRVTVPPFDWTEEEGGRSYYQVAHLGADLCGHPGIVHGGYLATMLDEGLARCCMPALPHRIGMTANLSINYRAPTPAGSYVILRCTTTKVEGRKAWVEGRIETLVGEGETPVVLADATALFISPKQAAVMKAIVPVSAA